MSSFIDWQDRSTCVLFGDGAGAVVLKSMSASESGSRGILASEMRTDGKYTDLLMVPGGGSRNPASERTVAERMHYLKMGGNTVFKHAVRSMSEAGLNVVEKAGLSKDDIDCVIPHQANMRIISAISEKTGISLERFFTKHL